MTILETQEPGWSQVMKHATIWLLFMVIWCFYKVFILSSWQVVHVSIYGEFQKEIGLNFHAYIYKILWRICFGKNASFDWLINWLIWRFKTKRKTTSNLIYHLIYFTEQRIWIKIYIYLMDRCFKKNSWYLNLLI